MKRVIAAVAIFLILAAGTAMAAPAMSAAGQWTLFSYLTPDLTLSAKHGICIVSVANNDDGTASGTWYSTTFSGWNGQWKQDSDRIRLYGTTTGKHPVSTAEFGQFVSNTLILGEFAHFFPTGPVATSSIGNFRAFRTSSICDAPASPAFSAETSDPVAK